MLLSSSCGSTPVAHTCIHNLYVYVYTYICMASQLLQGSHRPSWRTMRIVTGPVSPVAQDQIAVQLQHQVLALPLATLCCVMLWYVRLYYSVSYYICISVNIRTIIIVYIYIYIYIYTHMWFYARLGYDMLWYVALQYAMLCCAMIYYVCMRLYIHNCV